MRLRVFIIEPDDALRESLAMFVAECGHEVVAATAPETCPFYRNDSCVCLQEHACGDILLLGQHLPLLKGITFIERRLRGGCKGMIANVALLCRPWSDSDRRRAEALGCRYLETPLRLTELADWLQLVAQRVNPQRQLTPLPVPV